MDKKKKNIELELIENIKKEKLNKIFHTEEINKKINWKKILYFFMTVIIISFFIIIGTIIYYLYNQYIEYKTYKENNKEIIEFGEKYKRDKKLKEEELKKIDDLTLSNINNLPEEKKIVFLNLIPNGSPLTKELYVTSPFGTRVHPVSGKTREHHGVDFRLDVGDDVISTAIGVVTFAGKQNGYGNVVKIRHFNGFETTYAHLDKILIKNGELVGKGKKIALGGNTGVSTGPHLHYEIRYNGVPIDPMNFVKWDKENFNIVFENERSIQWEYFLTIAGKN